MRAAGGIQCAGTLLTAGVFLFGIMTIYAFARLKVKYWRLEGEVKRLTMLAGRDKLERVRINESEKPGKTRVG